MNVVIDKAICLQMNRGIYILPQMHTYGSGPDEEAIRVRFYVYIYIYIYRCLYVCICTSRML